MIQMDASDFSTVIRSINRTLKTTEEGKLVKRKASARLRKIVQPLVAAQRARVLALPSKGHPGQSMRQAIAKRTRAAVRWSGQDPGVSIVQRGSGMPRDFRLAGRVFNRQAGWNPQNLGGIKHHQQIRPANWFDSPTQGKRPEVQHELMLALEEVAATMAQIARRR